jgi:hypothetical protein
MDVYHKVLTRIYEVTDGKETADVDMNDLLKREGFYPSRDDIITHLSNEGWVTSGGRQYEIRITHWGVAEAKKAMANLPDKKQLAEKAANNLLTGSREFVIMLEEFAAGPSKEKFKTIDKRYSDLGAFIERLRSNL